MPQTAPEGLALAFELTQVGIEMKAQQYRRDHPLATDEAVEVYLQAWLLDRPGAPDGDAEGPRRAL